MKKKLLFSFIASSLLALSISSCNQGSTGPDYSGDERYQIYLLAKESGYTGTYEEWLASIKGKDGQDGKDGKDGADGRDGQDGHTPVIEIIDGYWYIDGVNTDVKAVGEDGTNGKDGVDGVDGVDGQDGKDGVDGKDGKDGTDGKDGIDGKDGTSMLTGKGEPSNSFGNVGDSYVDTDTWDYYVKTSTGWVRQGNIKGSDGQDGKNGTDGKDGIDGVSVVSIQKTETNGLIDTYTITYSNGNTDTFYVTNGEQGVQGIKGEPGADGYTPRIEIIDGYWFVDGVNTNVMATGINGKDGVSIVSIQKIESDGLYDTYEITYSDWTVDKPHTSTFIVKNGEDGLDGTTPHIGENGDWWIGEIDTGIKAEGSDGKDGKDGVDGTDGKDGKDGQDGHTPVIQIINGYWYIDGVDTGVKAQGYDGKDGVDGKDGTAVLTGNGEPLIINGKNGDSYIDLDTWDYYVKENNQWVLKGNIKGTDGTDYIRETHTVCFDSTGGSEVESQQVLHGEKITKPANPTWNGHTFTGWTYQGELWSFIGYVVTEDMTLTANWDLIDYTVTFKNDDGTVLETQNNMHYGDNFIYHGETPIKSNPQAHYTYTFTGWDYELVVTGDMILTAQYDAEFAPIQVTYLDENDNVLYTKYIKEGDSDEYVGDLPSKESTGESQYSFDGWIVVSSSQDSIVYKASFQSCSNGLSFYCDKQARVNGYSGTQTEVVIPSRWEGKDVVRISDSAFENCTSITSITIPNSVASIGMNAFSHCTSLTSIVIPDSVTSIDMGAFSHCTSLTSITIPDSVTSIEGSTFSYCTSLTSVTLGNKVTSIDGAFFNCTSLTSITIPDSVVSIGYSTFYNCTSLTSITIPDSVASIGDGAFHGCTSLRTVVLSKNLSTIDAGVFWGCSSLETITIPNGVHTIKSSAFFGCESLLSVTIPESLTKIEDSAFSSCPNLVEVINNSSITLYPGGGIGDGNIAGCAKVVITDGSGSKISEDENGFVTLNDGTYNWLLDYRGTESEITIPSNIDKIYKLASRKEVTAKVISAVVPSSVTEVKDSAFYDCYKLAQIINNSSVEIHNAGITKVVVTDGSGSKISEDENGFVTLNDGTYIWLLDYRGSEPEITIPSEITYIYRYAFKNNQTITSVEFQDGVARIGVGAFYNCRSLESVVLPNCINSIEGYAFYNCSSLATISIPNGITYIGDYSFSGCASLISIDIPESITSIYDGTFKDCVSLTNATIRGNITSFNSGAFDNCHLLESITIGVTIEKANILMSSILSYAVNLKVIHCTDGDIEL